MIETNLIDDRIFQDRITLHEIIEKLRRFHKENPHIEPVSQAVADLLAQPYNEKNKRRQHDR